MEIIVQESAHLNRANWIQFNSLARSLISLRAFVLALAGFLIAKQNINSCNEVGGARSERVSYTHSNQQKSTKFYLQVVADLIAKKTKRSFLHT